MEAQSTNGAAPDVVLIHGIWMTPRSGEHWTDLYKEFEGLRLLPGAPGWEEVADCALEWATNPVANV